MKYIIYLTFLENLKQQKLNAISVRKYEDGIR